VQGVAVLTREENEMLTRTGPGTPMGQVMRRYWLPALLADELPAPDCAPVKVRLLGEDLVAFRDSEGQVGLLDEFCAHRRASLFLGRNEECGLRCIYHGWKYDVEGRILDTPVEPEQSNIRHHVRQTAYPCREVNGVVYTYMGQKRRCRRCPTSRAWPSRPSRCASAARC
jgi:phthalate 4,5-dioxygenase